MRLVDCHLVRFSHGKVYKDDDHREDAPHFIGRFISFCGIPTYGMPKPSPQLKMIEVILKNLHFTCIHVMLNFFTQSLLIVNLSLF